MNNYKKQSGAVIITVLLLLMVITLMGVTSIKQGLYQARISSSEVAYSTCFMSAESGLNSIFHDANTMALAQGDPALNPIISLLNEEQGPDQTTSRCLDQNGILANMATCDGITNADIQVNMMSEKIIRPAQTENKSNVLLGYDISGSSKLGEVRTTSTCQLPGMDLAVSNVQEWRYTQPLQNVETN